MNGNLFFSTPSIRTRLLVLMTMLQGFLLFTLPFPLWSFSKEQKDSESRDVIVPLQTKHTYNALYVGNFSSPRASLAPTYLDKLRSVLLFDLNCNGSTLVQPQTEAAQKELAHGKGLSPLFWKKQGSDFVIKTTLDGYTLFTTLFNVKTGLSLSLPPFPLSGQLNADRRIMHKIADRMCSEITGTPGIASTRILYALKKPTSNTNKGGWESEIWEVDYDGHNQRQITSEKAYCISPHFFHNTGTFTQGRFFYVNYKQGQSKVYVARFSESKGIPLISLRGNQLLPTISKQGNLLAFISDASGRADLFIQPLRVDRGPVGKPIQVYSFPGSVQASPTFSPDGKHIAFVSDKGGTPRIYIIATPYPRKPLKTHLECITKKHRENTSPCWSPDGKKLAYSAKIDGIRQIMIYDFKTKEEIQLTHGKNHKENPSFAPNSLHLIFNTVDSSSELFVINLKQRKVHQITQGTGEHHYPSWGPMIQR